MKIAKLTNLCLLIAALCLPTLAHAARACNDGCDGAPVAVNPSAEFSLNLAEALFHEGVQPQLRQLVGNWKFVGIVNVPGNPTESYSPNEYNQKGIKNSDGSPEFSLQIRSNIGSGQTNFAGETVVIPSVEILGLGEKSANQGPNEVTLNNGSHAACFAQYAYDDAALTKSHYNYKCRLLRMDSNKMVCSLSFFLAPSDDGQVISGVQAWSGQVWEYFAFVKE